MVQEELLDKQDRVELIEGLLVVKKSKKPPHVVAGKKGLRALERIIPQGWHVAKEDPIVVSGWSEPEPDLAVVRGRAEDYLQRQVTAAEVALVVEISQSSLTTDRSEMERVYAASGIPFYWIVNLVDGQVEVYTGPGPAGYQSRPGPQTGPGRCGRRRWSRGRPHPRGRDPAMMAGRAIHSRISLSRSR